MSKASSDTVFLTQFVTWAENRSFCHVDLAVKKRLHREVRTVLRILAVKLELCAGDYDIRTHLGYVTEAGETQLTSSRYRIVLRQEADQNRLQFVFQRGQRGPAEKASINTIQHYSAPIHVVLNLQKMVNMLKLLPSN